MRYIKEIFPYKNLESADDAYDEFMQQKEKYMKDKSDDNYFGLMMAYMSIDADLKMYFNYGILSSEEFFYIRSKLKEGL